MTPFYQSAPRGPTAALAERMQALVPVIETDRMILRAPRIEDFQAYAAIALGPQGRYFGAPRTQEDAWRDFLQMTGTWLLRGHGAWVLTRRDGGDVLGFALIGAEPGDEEPELGYLLAAEAQGQGYATEAALAVRDHGFGPMGLPSMVGYIDTRNERSHRLAERIGGTREATRSEDGETYHVYRYACAGTGARAGMEG